MKGNQWNSIAELPPARTDLKVLTLSGDELSVFRCGCREGCMDWRCSLSGYGMIIDVEKWKLEEE